jgi:magnesium transporter
VVTIFCHREGRTQACDRVDPAWLRPASHVLVWVDLESPTADEAKLLNEVFEFHELTIEDALAETHHPKIEAYDGYLYVILHGIDFRASRHVFATHDVDFFLGRNYLVTVHTGPSRSIARLREICDRSGHALGEGPVPLMHRIIDALVDNYLPEVEKLQQKLDQIEKQVFERPRPALMRSILDLKRDVASLRRVTLPQRDVVGRLARREFPVVSDALAYRFRDVYDHLVRLTDEATSYQDRISGLLDAHLSNVSNQLNAVMKVLTVIATVFMPLTVLTGVYGMNVPLPRLPGGDAAQFWWILGIMVSVSGLMLWAFRRKGWL